jgi:hypothetical protein
MLSVFYEFRNAEIHSAIWTRSQEAPFGSHKFESVKRDLAVNNDFFAMRGC